MNNINNNINIFDNVDNINFDQQNNENGIELQQVIAIQVAMNNLANLANQANNLVAVNNMVMQFIAAPIIQPAQVVVPPEGRRLSLFEN